MSNSGTVSGPSQFNLGALLPNENPQRPVSQSLPSPDQHHHHNHGHDHDHGHSHSHNHDHGAGQGGHNHSQGEGHVHGDKCQHGGCGSSAPSPWNILPWDECKRSLEMVPMDDVEYPTLVSSCQSIADWEAALQHGTLEVNVSDERGMTGFHYAVRRGNLNVVKYLVSRNADVYKLTDDVRRASVLHLAVESGDVATLQFLVSKGVPTDSKDILGETPAHLAVRIGHLIQLTYLLRTNSSVIDMQDIQGRTLLHTAILDGSYNCMKQILSHHPNVYIYDNSGMLPIHQSLATSNPHALMLLAEYDFKQFNKTTKKGDRIVALAVEAGDETLLKVVRQYASMANFPSWFKEYMWHLSSMGWVFALLVATFFINFWLLLGASIFGIRTIYQLTQNEHFKTSKNPVIASALVSGSMAAMIGYFIWTLPHAMSEHPLLAILIIPLYGLAFELYRRTYFRDPGYHSYSAQDTLEFALELKNEEPIPTLCETCLGNRPMRTKHCSKCERCIDGAQHHCTPLNFCVGKNTHAPFLSLLITTAAWMLLWLYLTVPYLITSVSDGSEIHYWNVYALIRSSLDFNGGLTVLAAVGAVGFAYTCAIILFHLKLIALNVTAYENAHWSRYDYMMDSNGEYANPSNKGIFRNVKDFFATCMSSGRGSDPKTV